MKLIIRALVLLVVACVPTLRSSNIINAKTSCPSSGALAIASTSTRVQWAAIQAPFGNAGTVYIGQSNVSSTTGVALAPGGSLTLQSMGNSAPYDLSKTYFACSNSADAVVYVAAQ